MTHDKELMNCPYISPRFGIGDIVVPSDDCVYRHDYRGIYLIVAEVSFDPARDKLTYSTLPWPNESKEGMTTDWPESDLTLYKSNPWNHRAEPATDSGEGLIDKFKEPHPIYTGAYPICLTREEINTVRQLLKSAPPETEGDKITCTIDDEGKILSINQNRYLKGRRRAINKA